MEFEWDEAKNTANLRQHGVTFEEAITVFDDPHSITIPDPLHSTVEDRFVDLCLSIRGRILVVVYTERQARVRIVSCREATRTERKAYE